MASIKYYLNHPYSRTKTGRKKLKKDPVSIYMYVTFNRSSRIRIKLQETIKPELWDFSSCRMKTSKSGALEFNHELGKYESKANKAIQQFSGPDLKELKHHIEISLGLKIEQKQSFYDVLDDFMSIKAQDLDTRTVQKFKTLKRRIQQFEAFTGYKVAFDNINLQFFDKFKNYLFTVPKGKDPDRKGLLNDTVGKYMEDLKNFLVWSFDREYHSNESFHHLKANRSPKVDNPVLSLDELRKIYSHDFSQDKRLDRIRDLLCFACFTGQRWSDIISFDKKDLVKIDGHTEWHFTQKKRERKQPVYVKLPFIGYSAPALDILEKYDFQLPQISEQKFNDYVKDVGQACDISTHYKKIRSSGNNRVLDEGPKWKFFSSHMARRTCVTLLLEMGVPPTTVMKMTGIRKLDTVLKYENTSDQALRAELNRVGSLGYPLMKIAK